MRVERSSFRYRLIYLSILLLTACVTIDLVQVFNDPGDRLFYDNFSDPKSGWTTWTDENGSSVNYQNDGLRFVINEPQCDFWSIINRRYINVQLHVETIKVSGPDDNNFGLLCRFDKDRYYAFLITSDGYAGILKVKPDQYALISGDNFQYSSIVRQGATYNFLRADCINDELTLYVNGEQLLTARDSEFQRGKVGLVAGTYSLPGVDIYFDNFVVYNP